MFYIVLSQAQNGIIGTGFTNGWSNGDIVGFGAGVSGTRILIRNAPDIGNRFFRFVRNWDGDLTQYAPFGCGPDVEWTNEPNIEYLNMPACSNGAFYINCPNTTDNYVFKTRGQFGNSFVYFRIQGAIRSASTVSSPLTVTTNEPYEVDVELDGPLSTGQQVYLRYTSNNFSSSSVVSMTGSGTSFSAQIPGFPLGTNVIYYVFTSGNNSSVINHANADLYTININNNGGPNYSYTVQAPLHVSVLNFSAIEKASDVYLSASIDFEKPILDVTFQKMSEAENGKSNWNDIAVILSPQIESELSYTEKDIAPGVHYYRLAIMDRHGLVYYSSIQKVSIRVKSNISIYPNPFRNELSIKGLEDAMESKIVIYDLLGRVVFESIMTDGISKLDVSGIRQGIYTFHLLDNSGRILHQKLLMK